MSSYRQTMTTSLRPRWAEAAARTRTHTSWFWTIIVSVAAVQLIFLAYYLVRSNRIWLTEIFTGKFTIATLRVFGNQTVGIDDIAEIIEPYQKIGLASLDLDAVARRLEQDDWIRNAIVRRDFPETLEIRIAERHPEYRFFVDGRWWAADRFGFLICDLAAFGGRLQTVPVALQPIDGRTVAADIMRKARALVEKSKNSDWQSRGLNWQLIDLRNPDDVLIQLSHRGWRLRLGKKSFERSLQRFLDAWPVIADVETEDIVFDLRFSGQVVWPGAMEDDGWKVTR